MQTSSTAAKLRLPSGMGEGRVRKPTKIPEKEWNRHWNIP
jgi:hypothetical protein